MTLFIGTAYGLLMLALLIAFLISWFSSRKRLRIYKRYGILAGGILIAFDILVLLSAGAENWSSMKLIVIIALGAIVFVKMMAYTIVGIYMCTLLGYQCFPLLKPQVELLKATETDDPSSRRLSTPEPLKQEQRPALTEAPSTAESERHDAPSQTVETRPEQPPTPKINVNTYVSIPIAIGIGAVVYSAVLFWLTSPQMSDIVKQKFGESNAMSLTGLLLLLEHAFAEEIVFRLGIQNYLAKQLSWRGKKYWIAISLSAILWTLGHTGVMEPNWVKLAQIFPVGLALGWLFKRLGTESCILAHALFNVGCMAFVSPLVLR
ncbi:MAG: CPBP family intramembrane metalloprotease [Phycisphaerales bacterium]|nr:MAG: CPBP family intramembrane metalloprotease [Phycisphaerales bacterium]